ncbi:MAG: STAS domain-containing protein [Chloroflexota bacterium]|nr:STAS domain-containing protein [Chloroflexota bacterium]
MFSFTFNFVKSTSLTTSESTTPAENRLAHKDLMLGLSIKQKVVTIYLVGKLNAATSPLFKEMLKSFLDSPYKSFVFDLSSVDNLGTAGAVTLLQIYNQILEVGGCASIIRPNQSICPKPLVTNVEKMVALEISRFPFSVN